MKYIQGFKLLFSNSAAVLVIVASFFRTFQTVTLSFYLPRYFAVFPGDYEKFANLNVIATFTGGILTNIITAVITDVWDSNPMTKPLICFFKAFIDIPCNAAMFLQ